MCPRINLHRKRPTPITQNKKDYQFIYQDPRWKDIREYKLRENPLCELCEQDDIVEIATCVHHRIPFIKGKTPDEVDQLAFDVDNTQSLCDECHAEIHQILKGRRKAAKKS